MALSGSAMTVAKTVDSALAVTEKLHETSNASAKCCGRMIVVPCAYGGANESAHPALPWFK